MVGGQRIQVGLGYARKTVRVSAGPDTYEITVETGTTVTAARTTGRDIRPHKTSNCVAHQVSLGILAVRSGGWKVGYCSWRTVRLRLMRDTVAQLDARRFLAS
jgi:hypothetical protein